jgi:hypothetical protein
MKPLTLLLTTSLIVTSSIAFEASQVPKLSEMFGPKT